MILRLADWLVFGLLGLEQASRLGESVHFFVYDTIKIVFLVSIMIFGISFIRSFIPPEKARRFLTGGNRLLKHLLAALLGIVTPFCSCSSVPIFIGFVETGVPIGVTFSFLIASPLVNEISLVMLFGLFGWKIALLYVTAGVLVAVIGGLIIGRLKLESEVEDYVYKIQSGQAAAATEMTMTLRDRADFALDNVKDIVKKIWLYVVIGIGVGAAIHGYAPEDLLIRWAGPGNMFAVPLAVLLGVPLYSNAVGTIPIAQALIAKGVSVGTALSFMMAVTALSLPEIIILRKVIKPRLIKIFVGIVATGIVIVGYLFNAVL